MDTKLANRIAYLSVATSIVAVVACSVAQKQDVRDPAGALATPNARSCASDRECEDNNECTTDTCSTEMICSNTPNNNPCDDGDPCTLSDACSDGICQSGPVDECNDFNPCTTDSCLAGVGCENTDINGTPCTVDDDCTTGAVDAVCDAGSCSCTSDGVHALALELRIPDEVGESPRAAPNRAPIRTFQFSDPGGAGAVVEWSDDADDGQHTSDDQSDSMLSDAEDSKVPYWRTPGSRAFMDAPAEELVALDATPVSGVSPDAAYDIKFTLGQDGRVADNFESPLQFSATAGTQVATLQTGRSGGIFGGQSGQQPIDLDNFGPTAAARGTHVAASEVTVGRKVEYAISATDATTFHACTADSLAPDEPCFPQDPDACRGEPHLCVERTTIEGVLRRLEAEEELWVIATDDAFAPRDHDTPPSGTLLGRAMDDVATVPMPLAHTDVAARIRGYIASVRVQQQFHNPFDVPIEAVYVFPLPHDAAVNEFVMTIGDRRIRGIIRERAEAEAIYTAAREQGHTAALLTQERPNIFTQKVANIEPGHDIDIDITYFNTLRFDDGAYEFVFPMAVEPRFNPPVDEATDDDRYILAADDAADTGLRPATAGPPVPPRLDPYQRSAHDIAVRVDIDAGVDLVDLTSPTHDIHADYTSDSTAVVELAGYDRIPNRDFVLRLHIGGTALASGMVVHQDGADGYFTLLLVPPTDLEHLRRGPVEMVFIIDASGSMAGAPMRQARTAVEQALAYLGPNDRFQIIGFSDLVKPMAEVPISGTPANIDFGLDYLHNIETGGGTVMAPGITAALDIPEDRGRQRIVMLISDGHIGNERDILAEVHARLGDARVFGFGVGNNVNRYLLEGMARLGRGAVAYVDDDDDAADAVDGFITALCYPALTDVAIDWGAMDVTAVFPRQLPDLLIGRPVVISGRFRGTPAETIELSGTIDGAELTETLAFDVAALPRHPAVGALWARHQLRDLQDHRPGVVDPEALTRLALEHDLVSSYTAFVAVDALASTGAPPALSVDVAIPHDAVDDDGTATAAAGQ